MSREIDDLAKEIRVAKEYIYRGCDTVGENRVGITLSKKIAEHLTAKGYCKASEVAREIFEKFGKLCDRFLNREILCHEFLSDFAELQKEYTESEKDNGKV